MHNTRQIKIGVSACVLGQKVRFDGGHKRSNFVTDILAQHFVLQGLCPEMGIGMPSPRPAIHLVERDGDIALTDSKDQRVDHSLAMAAYFQRQRAQVAEFDGFVVAARSPSCGMERIKVFNDQGQLQHRKGRGLFTEKLMAAFPNLPVEEDGRLNDAGLKESFVTRVLAHHSYRTTVLSAPTPKALVDFHSRYKFLILAYHPGLYRELGRLVARVGSKGQSGGYQSYLALLMQALQKPADRKKHTNVLQHMQGFLKQALSQQEKRELVEKIEGYRRGYLPLMAPITLLQHHLSKHPVPYLSNQVYLQPFPYELGLRG